MRRLLCIFLAVFLLLSAAYCPNASAAVNYCAQFEDAINLLRWYAPYWDIAEGETFPLSSIINYTRQKLSVDRYGEHPIFDGFSTYYARYAIPADVFEAAAMDFFDIVDVRALRSYTSFFWDEENFTGIDNFQNYQEDRHVYLFSNSGTIGTSSHYQVMGYAPEQGKYRVYARFLSLLWERPAGTEGIDYVKIGADYYAVEHYLEALLDVSNGRVQFYSWKESSNRPTEELTGPLTVLARQESVTLSADPGIFPADTTFEIAVPSQDILQNIADALGAEAANFVAFQIRASAEPNGTVQAAFTIPEDFDPQRIALYQIDEEGHFQRLHAVVDIDQNRIIAELTQLGVYAVAELAVADPQPGDANGDGTINTRDARLIMQYIAGMISKEDLSLVAADFNDDGKINIRDARLLLQNIAGLTE